MGNVVQPSNHPCAPGSSTRRWRSASKSRRKAVGSQWPWGRWNIPATFRRSWWHFPTSWKKCSKKCRSWDPRESRMKRCIRSSFRSWMTNSNGTRRRRPGQGLCLPCESLKLKYSVVVPIRFIYMIGCFLVLVLLALILTAPNPHMVQQTMDGKILGQVLDGWKSWTWRNQLPIQCDFFYPLCHPVHALFQAAAKGLQQGLSAKPKKRAKAKAKSDSKAPDAAAEVKWARTQ